MSTESKFVPTMICDIASVVDTQPTVVPFHLCALMAQVVLYGVKGPRCQVLHMKWINYFIEAHQERLRMLLLSAWSASREEPCPHEDFAHKVRAHAKCIMDEAGAMIRPLAENPKTTDAQWGQLWEDAQRYDLESLYALGRLSIAAE